MGMPRSANGAAAGALAAGVWAAFEQADQRLFGIEYSDVELLGTSVSDGPGWPAIGTALHLANGALFGAAYVQVKPFLPGHPVVKGLTAGLLEGFATWPLIGLVERHHPARRRFPSGLVRNPRALAQATLRHAVFGIVLGLVEERLNADPGFEPPAVPSSTNGHGDLRVAVGAES